MAAILSLAMLLRDFGQPDAAAAIDKACAEAVIARAVTPDLGGTLTTDGVAEWVIARVGG